MNLLECSCKRTGLVCSRGQPTHARTLAHTNTHTHTQTRTNTHAPTPPRTHPRTHAPTHARTHARTHAYTGLLSEIRSEQAAMVFRQELGNPKKQSLQGVMFSFVAYSRGNASGGSPKYPITMTVIRSHRRALTYGVQSTHALPAIFPVAPLQACLTESADTVANPQQGLSFFETPPKPVVALWLPLEATNHKGSEHRKVAGCPTFAPRRRDAQRKESKSLTGTARYATSLEMSHGVPEGYLVQGVVVTSSAFLVCGKCEPFRVPSNMELGEGWPLEFHLWFHFLCKGKTPYGRGDVGEG